LQGRPGPGLYVLGWLLSGLGFGLVFVAVQTGPPIGGVLLMASLLMLLAGLSSAAGYQILERATRPEPYFRGPSPLILFGIQFVLVNIISLVLAIFGIGGLSQTPLTILIAAIVLLAGYVFVVVVFGIRTRALGLRDFRIPIPATQGRLVADLGIGLGIGLVTALGVGLWGGVLSLLLGTQPPDLVPSMGNWLDVVLVALATCVLIPFGEELFFRGYNIPAWLDDLGARSALLRSTAFFALVHIINILTPQSTAGAVDGFKQAVIEVLVIAPVGFVLGWLFLRRGLLASFGAHAGFNLFAVLTLLLVAGR
jgi:membrane protease YdiL (CAAX protease family)